MKELEPKPVTNPEEAFAKQIDEDFHKAMKDEDLFDIIETEEPPTVLKIAGVRTLIRDRADLERALKPYGIPVLAALKAMPLLRKKISQ